MNEKDYRKYKEVIKEHLKEDISDKDLCNYLINQIRPYLGIIPKSFYRYRSISDYVYSEIEEGYVYLTRPSKFDDLMDSKFLVAEETSADNLTNHILYSQGINYDSMAENLIKEYNEYYDSKLRIACFTQKKTNIPMWYYYAFQHKGICIKYDFSNLNSADNQGFILLPIIYPPESDIKDYYYFSPKKSNSVGLRNSLIKSKDWSFEKEWRLIKITENGEDFMFSVSISEIYLGIDTDEDTKNKIIESIKKSGKKIKLFKMVYTYKGLKPQEIKFN